MSNFYNSFTFILSFMILVMVFNSLFGATFTEYFLLLVLLSMIVLNGEKFATIFNGLKEG